MRAQSTHRMKQLGLRNRMQILHRTVVDGTADMGKGLHSRPKRRFCGASPLRYDTHLAKLARVQGNDPGAIPVASGVEYDGLCGENHTGSYAFPLLSFGTVCSCRFPSAPYICSLFRSSSAG